jgi:hypothetical protein
MWSMHCNVEFRYQLSIFLGPRKKKTENLDGVGRSKDLPGADWLQANTNASPCLAVALFWKYLPICFAEYFMCKLRAKNNCVYIYIYIYTCIYNIVTDNALKLATEGKPVEAGNSSLCSYWFSLGSCARPYMWTKHSTHGSFYLLLAGCMLCLFFDPEDGTNTFLRNISELYRTIRRRVPEGNTLQVEAAERERGRARLAQVFIVTSLDVTCAYLYFWVGETRVVSRVTVVCINVLILVTGSRPPSDTVTTKHGHFPSNSRSEWRTSSYCFSRGSLTRDKCFVQSVLQPMDLVTVNILKTEFLHNVI